MKKTFTTTIERDGSMCFVPIPFDPRSIFGKVRVPVKVTLNGYTYRSTIASMGHGPCLPLRRSHREAAGLEGNETLRVTLERDASVRSLAARDRSTLALHMENLAGADVRAEALARLRRALDGIERAVSDAPPPGEKAKKSRR